MPRVEFEKYTLPNGLQVILHVDRRLPVVHVNQWFHVGSKNEKRGRTGFAHLFEHMMFQGSENAPEEYFTYVENAGANLFEGGVNGTTNFDRTNYFATVPSGSLEFLLWVESDRLATLTDALTPEKLDTQREVVRNERRQGVDNQPYGRWFVLVSENLHPADHPYSWPIIGSHEDLQAASEEDVTEFFERYYTPNNLTLVVAGDFDPAEAKRLIEKYFGGLPPGPALDRPARHIPTLTGEKSVEIADRVPQERVYMIWPVPPYFDEEEAALDVASMVLTDGLSSRLNRALVYDRQLATAVDSFNWANEISGAFIVIATIRPGASMQEVESIVTEEVTRLAAEGPSPQEVERAKTKWEYNFVTGLERIGGFGGKADRLAMYNTYLGDPGMFEADLARYRQVTPEALRASVARWIDTTNRLLMRFRPEASVAPEVTDLDRSLIPELGADRAWEPPQVVTAELDNGLEIFVINRPELPKVSVTLASRAGSMADPPGKEGLANLLIRTVDMGTSSRQALEIEDALGDLGTSLTGFAAREHAVVRFEVLERNLPAAMEIFADVVRNPTFPESEVERERGRQLDALSQQSNNANALASRIRPMVAFGADHPYGRPNQGLPSTVETIGRDDLTSFHDTYWQPGSSALVMVGAVSAEQAVELAEKSFGSWESGSAPGVDVPQPQPMGRGKIFLVDRPDAAQTVVAQILSAPRRKVEDYYALTLVDSVWGGGGFGTRLNLNLREDKGYSLRASSPNMSPLLRRRGLVGARGCTDRQDKGVGGGVRQGAGRAIAGHRAPSRRPNWRTRFRNSFVVTPSNFESYPRIGKPDRRPLGPGVGDGRAPEGGRGDGPG